MGKMKSCLTFAVVATLVAQAHSFAIYDDYGVNPTPPWNGGLYGKRGSDAVPEPRAKLVTIATSAGDRASISPRLFCDLALKSCFPFYVVKKPEVSNSRPPYNGSIFGKRGRAGKPNPAYSILDINADGYLDSNDFRSNENYKTLCMRSLDYCSF